MKQGTQHDTQYLAQLLDVAHDAIMVMDHDAIIEFWNGGAERLYGWSKLEATGRRSHDLLSTKFSVPLEEIREELHRNGEWNGELIHTQKGGKKITVSSRWVLMFDEAGSETGFLEINRDISDRKKLQEQLVQARRMEALGRLAGGVAHDFNNLLTVILGYAASLRNRLDAEHPLRSTVGEIERAATQAALVTGQLLTFSRRHSVQFQVIEFNSFIQELKNILERLVGEDIDLALRLENPSRCVKADAGQLTQVLMNLAANARDAMPNGGKLTVETRFAAREQDTHGTHDARPAGRFVVLTVTDTGSGMDSETRAHIFEPFFTTKEVGKGTGLGLATTYGIVKEHGGWIDVYSEPGHGTSFCIYFPVADEQAPAEAPTASAIGPRRAATILLVEDQAAIRMLAQDVLEEAGHRVLAAGDGAAALKVAQSEPNIDVLVTDVVMPHMSGPQLAEKLIRSRPGLIVLYTSGYTGHALFRNSTLESGTSFLNKPFTPDALVAKVDELLAPQDNQD